MAQRTAVRPSARRRNASPRLTVYVVEVPESWRPRTTRDVPMIYKIEDNQLYLVKTDV